MNWLKVKRIEWTEDALDRAQAQAYSARKLQRAFGGYKGDVRRAERKVARLERKLDRLTQKGDKE